MSKRRGAFLAPVVCVCAMRWRRWMPVRRESCCRSDRARFLRQLCMSVRCAAVVAIAVGARAHALRCPHCRCINAGRVRNGTDARAASASGGLWRACNRGVGCAGGVFGGRFVARARLGGCAGGVGDRFGADAPAAAAVRGGYWRMKLSFSNAPLTMGLGSTPIQSSSSSV